MARPGTGSCRQVRIIQGLGGPQGKVNGIFHVGLGEGQAGLPEMLLQHRLTHLLQMLHQFPEVGGLFAGRLGDQEIFRKPQDILSRLVSQGIHGYRPPSLFAAEYRDWVRVCAGGRGKIASERPTHAWLAGWAIIL